MRKSLVGIIVLLGVLIVAQAVPSRCIQTTVTVSPAAITLGESVTITATFTNCGANNLSNIGADVYAIRDITYDCQSYPIPYTLISKLAGGQSVTLSATFTPPCAGEWEITSQMHPSALWAEDEAVFTVSQ